MNYFEAEILKNINSLVSSDFLDTVFTAISALGNKGMLWILLTLVLIIFKNTRRAGICCAVSLILCLVIGNILLKPLVGRIRPYDFDSTIKIIIPPLSDGSFPSGHTMAAFAFAYSAGVYIKKLRCILFTSAVLMGISRIYLCVHYPTDVIAGAIVGIAFGIISYKICERFLSNEIFCFSYKD